MRPFTNSRKQKELCVEVRNRWAQHLSTLARNVNDDPMYIVESLTHLYCEVIHLCHDLIDDLINVKYFNDHFRVANSALESNMLWLVMDRRNMVAEE